MPLVSHRVEPFPTHRSAYSRCGVCVIAGLWFAGLASCSSDQPTDIDQLEVASISIDSASFELARHRQDADRDRKELEGQDRSCSLCLAVE